MRVSWLAIVAAAAGAVFADKQGTQSTQGHPKDPIALAVRTEIEAGLFPGAVVLVGTSDRVLYHEAFGHSRISPELVPMRKDSIFDMASVTKVVATATACALLADTGKLDPDAVLSEYLRDHTGDGIDQIPLRRIASHTAGFPEHPNLGRKGKGDNMFAVMLTESPSWQCNSRYQYACRNAILLSTVVERVSGQPFGSFCHDRLFTPLEMVDTCFVRVPPSERTVASHSPILGASGNIDVVSAGRAVGNAGLFTTAADLSHFCEMMLSGGEYRGQQILSPATIEEFTRLEQLPQFPGRGFLWEIDANSLHRPTLLSEKAYGHSGFTGQSLWLDPEKDVYLVVLTNRTAIPDHRQKKTEQYRARSRIGDAALKALGFTAR